MPTLQALVDALGPTLVHVAAAPSGLEQAWERIVVHDPLEHVALARDDLLIGVGLTQPVAGPAAVLLKAEPQSGSAQGPAVLVLAPGLPWTEVIELVTALRPPKTDLPEPESGSEVIEDLFALANAIARWIGASITIEDNQSRLLAYSGEQEGVDDARAATILGHRVPEAYRQEVRRAGVGKRLLTETEPFYVTSRLVGISPRVIVALRSRDEVLGSIWVVTPGPLGDERMQRLADAAQVVSARLVRHRLTNDLKRRHREVTVAAALRGEAVALTGESLHVLALRGRSGDDIAMRKALVAMESHEVLAPQSLIAAQLGDTVYAVLSCPPHDLRSLLEGLPDLVVGVSGPCSNTSELPAGKDEAEQVLRVLLTKKATTSWATLSDVGTAVLLQRLRDAESTRRYATSSVLDVIAAHDDEHATNYLDTLREHLASFGDAAVAAEALGIHANTLRYRLRRLDELFSLDLTDEDVRLGLVLDYKLRR